MNRADRLESNRLPPGPEAPGGKDHNLYGPIRVPDPAGSGWIWVHRDVHPPELPGAIPFDFSPGTLGTALAAEAEGRGSVRFHDGIPYWMADPPRFPGVTP